MSAIVDALGMPMDEKIVHLVSLLRHLGWDTTASCSGHATRATAGPYVIIRSPAAHWHYASTDPRDENRMRESTNVTMRQAAPLLKIVESHNASAPAGAPLLELRHVGHAHVGLCFVNCDFDRLRSESEMRKVLEQRRAEIDRLAAALERIALSSVPLIPERR
ncbi:hypothetical protein DEJ00_08415 [Curtobacterium sp. MCLR17_039]|nr:hypothetical protein DEJ00_08415 [Curtobacterium sp. MCLR17_039]